MKKKFRNNFWIKLRSWEYWPWYIIYIPVFIYWLWCGIKARTIFYISAVNPGFEYGGIIGASKTTILNKIPSKYLPLGLLVDSSDSVVNILEQMQHAKLAFPLIAKPDIGERGYNVELISDKHSLDEYLSNSSGKLIIQEYIDKCWCLLR